MSLDLDTEELPVTGGAPVDPLIRPNAEAAAHETARHDQVPGGVSSAAHRRPTRVPAGQFVTSIVLPGAASWRRAPFVAAGLLLLGVVLPLGLAIVVVRRRADLIALAFDPDFLLAVTALAVLGVATRLIAVGEVAYAHRRVRGVGPAALLAASATLVLGSPALWVAHRAFEARQDVADAFAGSDDPLFVPESGVAGQGVVTPDGIHNVLLLGGDAGPGRWGMRTDTMILVTVDRASGRTALTSIPRNLTRLQFPPGTPLAERFPDGFDDLANAVFTEVNTDPALVAHYGASGLQPEAVALSEAIGYSLDVRIDDFMLVNMQGFTEVVDAVGGVTLELGQRVPLPPSLPGERPLPTEIGPGFVEMDGALAIAYARSRSADSDYQRMGRQRQLLAALGNQVSTTEALGAFGTVTGALDDSMRTSLSADGLSTLVDRLGDNNTLYESVGLAPPLITPGSPDYAQIRAIVDAVQAGVVAGTPSGFAT